MKMLMGCVLAMVLSGCIPIGIKGTTLADAGPTAAAPVQARLGCPAATARLSA